jgi:hypothetical protein
LHELNSTSKSNLFYQVRKVHIDLFGDTTANLIGYNSRLFKEIFDAWSMFSLSGCAAGSVPDCARFHGSRMVGPGSSALHARGCFEIAG